MEKWRYSSAIVDLDTSGEFHTPPTELSRLQNYGVLALQYVSVILQYMRAGFYYFPRLLFVEG
jgi:hypothetical protein